MSLVLSQALPSLYIQTWQLGELFMLLQSLSLTKFIYTDLAASSKYHQALPSLYIQTWQLQWNKYHQIIYKHIYFELCCLIVGETRKYTSDYHMDSSSFFQPTQLSGFVLYGKVKVMLITIRIS